MSRIIQAESDVEVYNVRFADLEGGGNEGCFFERLYPAEKAADQDPPANKARQTAPHTEEQITEQPVDIEAIREEAYTKGKKEGRAEVEKKLHSTAQSLADALEQISRLRESLLSKSKEDMVRLVMAVARQVVQTDVEEKEDIIVNTVKKTLEAAVAADEYYIRVHPEDLAIVKEHEPLFLAAMKGLQNIHFMADESISRGGCVAESRAGDVDATIETQLSEIKDHLCQAVM
ncbi:MAG: flagellar assembly protein FliH [Desulfobacteraceae bacterium]|nr:flagellar assembly protein FliH [Desulfobacteraceae bacterium]MCF8094272.1 flagellar assembly protein FliH [Desulfobacteraceae bacterium]